MASLSFVASGTLDFSFVGLRLGATYDLRGMSAKLGLTAPDVFPNDFYSQIYLSISNNTTTSSSSGSIITSVVAYGPWTISDNVSWLSLSPISGSSSQNVTITKLANSGGSRIGTVTLTLTATGQTVQQTITQSAGGVATTAVTLGRSFVNEAGACNAFAEAPGIYWVNSGADFSSAVALYSNSSGTTNAGADWYSDGSIVRRWNGSSFSTTGLCLF